jgi:U3 small nucleolar RNA-associated protein 15
MLHAVLNIYQLQRHSMACTVQIIELDGFTVTHASRYPAPILSLGISPDCGTLAVGMADGALSLRRHDRPHTISTGISAKPAKRPQGKPRLTAANFRCVPECTSRQSIQ